VVWRCDVERAFPDVSTDLQGVFNDTASHPNKTRIDQQLLQSDTLRITVRLDFTRELKERKKESKKEKKIYIHTHIFRPVYIATALSLRLEVRKSSV
jgi:hypothetical protein